MNAATASRKRPLLALVPDHRRGFESHHPLQLLPSDVRSRGLVLAGLRLRRMFTRRSHVAFVSLAAD